jgi:predicted component of type VI protein secretion system
MSDIEDLTSQLIEECGDKNKAIEQLQADLDALLAANTRMKEALKYYMSQFGQCLDAYGIEYTNDQIEADNQARVALKTANTKG